MSVGLVSLLALADSRLPAGGHAHSGGVEPAIATGLIRDLDDLAVFLRSRLRTAGLVAAGLAAAACHRAPAPDRPAATTTAVSNRTFREAVPTSGTAAPNCPASPVREVAAVWLALDAEADARIASPAQRVASRQQGRALLRAGRAAWPSPVLDALAAGPTTRDSAASGPAQAASAPVSVASGLARATSAPVSAASASAPAASAPAPAASAPAPAGSAAGPADPNRTFREAVPTSGTAAPNCPASPVRQAAGRQPPHGPHHPVALGAVGAAAGCDPAGVAHVAAYLAISGPAAAAVRLRGYDPFAVQALLAALTPDVTEVAERAAGAAPGPLRDLPCAAAPRLDLLAELHAASEVRLFAS